MNACKNTYRALAVLTSCSFLVACATNQGGSQLGQADDPCNMGQTILISTTIGAILGAVVDGSKGAVKGAAAGAAVGAIACFAMNWRSEQTKTAAQAEQDYLRNNPTLPAEPKVVTYTSQLQSGHAQRGQPLLVQSTLELVNGRDVKVNEIREELAIYSPDGKPVRTGDKPFTATSAGRFENSFQVTLPQNAPQGVYGLRTTVFVNGSQVATRDLSAQLVWDGTSATILAMR